MRANVFLPGRLTVTKFIPAMSCYIALAVAAMFFSCAKERMTASPEHLKSNTVSTVKNNSYAVLPGKNVMMESFYTNVTSGGVWWGTLQGKVSSWASAGITSMWLPPVTKGASGAASNGYDPYDYFDFGNYNQMGTTSTRYGGLTDLQSLISAAHNAGLQVYADIVMNHCYGGSSEYNPNTGGNTNTAFTPASGIFPRHYNDFHPSTYEVSDAGTFSNFPDFCHKNPDVSGGFWSNSNSVAIYYKNTMHFDGWRFDWVDGYSPSYVQSFVTAAPGFAVTEYWGPSNGTSVSELQSCISASGQSTFDFPCMFALQAAFTNNNLADLSSMGMVCKSNPAKAVTFVQNHDVNDIPDANKLQAYAFILAHEGTPCIFYSDYESLLSKTAMNTLIWINKNLAAGTTSVLYSDNDEYVGQMNGSPGLVIYINNSNSTLSRTITTQYKSSDLHDFSNNVTSDVYSDASGGATISAPAHSFSIWSANGAAPSTITVTLRMLEDVTNGYSLFFTGDDAQLTNWGTGVQGSWNSGNYWTTTITLPAGTTEISWKVRKGTTGGSGNTYESGSNHVINNPVNGTTYTSTFNGGF